MRDELQTGGASHPPRVLLCSPDPPRLENIERLLREENYETTRQTVGASRPDDNHLATFDLVVIDSPLSGERGALAFCRELRRELGERFLPILYLTDNADQSQRVFSAEVGADAHMVRPIDRVEFMAQVKTFLRIKMLQDRVVEQSAELKRMNRRLELAYDMIDKELDLARRIQQSFLPQFLPAVPGARFGARMEVSGRVGGDFYDVVRLDEQSIGFYVADAMGHGVPASLLTIYVKKGIVPKDVFDHGYRLVAPAEVLARLNRDMLAQQLSENPFVSMVYGVLHLQTLKLVLARAGHPYPLWLKSSGEVREIKAQGTLLGIFESEFSEVQVALEVGDRLLIYTDGIDGVRYRDRQQGLASLLACVADHRHLPIDQMIDQVYAALFPDGKHDDDVTLLGVEITES